MPSTPTPVFERARELLADGQWHGLERVIYELSKLVTPGQAMRRNERERALATPNRERKVPRTTDQLIRFGARRHVYDVIMHSNRFEIRGEPGSADRQIRWVENPLPPRFPGVTRSALARVLAAVEREPRAAIARRAGVHPTTVSHFAHDQRPSVEALGAIAGAVGVEVVLEHTTGTCETCGEPESEHIRLVNRRR